MVAFADPPPDALEDADVVEFEVLDVLDDVEFVAVFESDEHAATRKPVETRIKPSRRRMLPSFGGRGLVRTAGRERLCVGFHDRSAFTTVTCP
jgi:hypothetical protein